MKNSKDKISNTFLVISVSPGANEIAASPNPQIKVTFTQSIDSASINNISFSVFGERTAYHSGGYEIIDSGFAILFNTLNDFNAGEKVKVTLSSKIISSIGDSLKSFSWTFRIPTNPTSLNFTEPIVYSGGGEGMQCIDMNNDGYPDIVTSSGIIRINNGNGEFPTYWYLDDAADFYPIIVDDFNRDGYMDVFYGGTGGLTLGLGNGAGNFSKSYYPWWFFDYISDDFDSDGYPDIAGINGLSINPPFDSTSYCAIAYNDGLGQLIDTVWITQLTGKFQKISSCDVENDGDNDILIISHRAPINGSGLDGLAVFRNNDDGVFNEYQLYQSDIYFSFFLPKFIYTADFNNDGLTDIGIIGDGGGAIKLNTGNGFFGDGSDTTFIREIWGPESAAPLTGGDFNGNNWIDLAVSGYGFPFDPFAPKQYAVLNNNSSYFFNIFRDTIGTNSSLIYSTAAADLNNNGFLDLVHAGNGVYITRNVEIVPSVDYDLKLLNKFILYQNFPNPFNSQTELIFKINKTGIMQISIYNIIGEEVRSLESKELFSGNYKIVWDGKDNSGANLSSGVYLIQANFLGLSKTIKTIILK
ncbi:MAG: T9SS type A sorting domain-containing protein [Ignavibacteriae bacterium]|nr:T9SS type A sorting domain-containing protein [Ignavibacteriota bacterium]